MTERDESQSKDLLKEIKHHQSRQIKSCNNTEDFELVSSVTVWTDLFIRYFVNCEEPSHDDLLMFVKKKAIEGSRYFMKFQTQIEVFRKDSRKLPVGNVDIDWEETLYLNFINQCFEYHLTSAIVSRTGVDQMQILKKHSQRVFASPSFRSMHGKAESEDISYPSIYFSIDNYDQVQTELSLRAGDLVCIELLAIYKTDSQKFVLFSGSLDYDSLSMCCDVKIRMPTMFGLRAFGASRDKTTFVKVKSPNSEGEAEVAITRAPGSTCPTPTEYNSDSPGSDDWSKFEDFEYSAKVSGSLNQINKQWTDAKVDKTRSLGEGLDSLTKGTREIEAIDLRKELTEDTKSKKIWSRHGFSQSFHSWKERKRIKSLPVLVGVTFITLKYYEIMRILTDNNQEPMLTF